MWWRRFRYLLLLTGLCAIATCPAAKRACTAKQRSREADHLLEYLADRVEAAVAQTGRVPAEAAGPTPSPACCEQGGTCQPDPSLWATPGWQALRFSIDDEFRYTYSYLPDASGHSAIVRAVGDVACDGTTHVVEVEIQIDPDGVKRTWSRKTTSE
jgi:hypothetical protein